MCSVDLDCAETIEGTFLGFAQLSEAFLYSKGSTSSLFLVSEVQFRKRGKYFLRFSNLECHIKLLSLILTLDTFDGSLCFKTEDPHSP